RRQVPGQLVDVLGEVAPRPRDALHLRLTTQLPLGTHLARHARDLVGEAGELVHHRVACVLQLQDLALGVDGDLLRQVALRHRRLAYTALSRSRRQVPGQLVDVLGEVAPRPRDALHLRLTTQLPLGTHLTGHARDLV